MTLEVEDQIVNKEYVLSPLTRCDSCSAEALVWVKGVSGELMFCGHHYTKNEKALQEFAFELVDEREKLVQNKALGSAN